MAGDGECRTPAGPPATHPTGAPRPRGPRAGAAGGRGARGSPPVAFSAAGRPSRKPPRIKNHQRGI
eukprot:3844831-Prymnesium_polylepis.1